MKKYRIIQRQPDYFVIEEKGWFLWSPWGKYRYDDVFFEDSFPSLGKAFDAIFERTPTNVSIEVKGL